MLLFETLTQGYDPVEDRLFVDGRDKSGTVLRLWLTRRLADAVLSHLCDWLERSRSRGDSGFDQLLQSWDQQAAQAGLRGSKPVRWQGEAVLLVAIDLKHLETGCQLTFKGRLAGKPHAVAATTLDSQKLRQWLSILFRLYGSADWPDDVWPDWLRSAAQTPTIDQASD